MPLMQTEVDDAPITVDGAAHQIIHGQQSQQSVGQESVDGPDYSRELAFEASGVDRVRAPR